MEDGFLVVMVIEDEELLLKAIVKKLSLEKIKAITCTSVDEAVKELESGGQPDAVWLDYYLGNKSGLDFLKLLKSKDEWFKIPVVVVSNSASEVKKKEMLDAGAKAYFLKSDSKIEQIITEIIKIVM